MFCLCGGSALGLMLFQKLPSKVLLAAAAVAAATASLAGMKGTKVIKLATGAARVVKVETAPAAILLMAVTQKELGRASFPPQKHAAQMQVLLSNASRRK